MGEFLPSDPRNYPGFIHTVVRIRNPKYDDENAWSRMQRLLNSRVPSFAEPSSLRIRGIVHDAFVVRRATFLGKSPVYESDSMVDSILTTPLHLRERRIVSQALPHLENVLPVGGAAPLFQGILTWRPPMESINGRRSKQAAVESVPLVETVPVMDNAGLNVDGMPENVPDLAPEAVVKEPEPATNIQAAPTLENGQIDWYSLLK